MEELIPSKFFLSQNFPNPFEDSTKIKYCLPISTKANLSVYDSDNVKLRELVNKIQDTGTYEVKIENGDLPPGDYYYIMQAVNSETMTGQSITDTK